MIWCSVKEKDELLDEFVDAQTVAREELNEVEETVNGKCQFKRILNCAHSYRSVHSLRNIQ